MSGLKLKGTLANFEITGKVATVFLESKWKDKIQTKILKVIGEDNVTAFGDMYKDNQGSTIELNFYVSNQTEYQGKWYPSQCIVQSFVVVAPVVQRDTAPEKDVPPMDDDSESQLPF